MAPVHDLGQASKHAAILASPLAACSLLHAARPLTLPFLLPTSLSLFSLDPVDYCSFLIGLFLISWAVKRFNERVVQKKYGR